MYQLDLVTIWHYYLATFWQLSGNFLALLRPAFRRPWYPLRCQHDASNHPHRTYCGFNFANGPLYYRLCLRPYHSTISSTIPFDYTIWLSTMPSTIPFAYPVDYTVDHLQRPSTEPLENSRNQPELRPTLRSTINHQPLHRLASCHRRNLPRIGSVSLSILRTINCTPSSIAKRSFYYSNH